MAENENNYIKLCESDITVDARTSDKGKLLKNLFMIGPSKAVVKKGKIEFITSTSNTDSNNTNNAESSNNATNSQSNSTGDNNSNTANSSYIRNRNYTIYEAYSRMRLICEEDTPAQSSSSNQQQSTDSTDGSDSFKSGGPIYKFQVVLPSEGYTEWEVTFDANCQNVEQAINAIKAKNFKQAFEIASQGLKSDGLVPTSMSTFVVKNPKTPPAFIGHCRYGFDSGADDTNVDSRTVCLAIAPIIGNTNKPDQNFVIQAIYNITGDVTGGILGKVLTSLKGIFKKDNDRDYYNDSSDEVEQKISDEVSKYLKSTFKCVGDSTMYDNFLTIKKYLDTQVKEGNLEYSESQSTDLKAFAKKLNGKLVYF